MRILYITNQVPGFGGAATETYQAIQRLRQLGCTVKGVFIVLNRSEANNCNPDRLSNVHSYVWWEDKPISLHGKYDVVISKNYMATELFPKLNIDAPKIYLTSGIDCISRTGSPALLNTTPIKPDTHDYKAFAASDYVIVHSTLDIVVYENLLEEKLRNKIFGEVVYTPNIAVRPIGKTSLVPYARRKYDLLFSASTWHRKMKNPEVMKKIVDHYKGRLNIVVCGCDIDENNCECTGLVTHQRQLDIMKNTKIAIIPSLYDPSPNLYPEAIFCGCNVITNPNVGNCEFHPSELKTNDMRFESFVKCIDYALGLDEQLNYITPTPEQAAKQLLDRLEEILEDWKSRRDE